MGYIFFLVIELKLKSLKLFFGSWKGRHPIFLQTISFNADYDSYEEYDLIEKYKAEEIIKKYDSEVDFEDFEFNYLFLKLYVQYILNITKLFVIVKAYYYRIRIRIS